MAAAEGDIEQIRNLISLGFNVNQTDKYNDTPIILAAEYGHFEIVDELLKNNADPNHFKSGTSAIFAAVNEGYADITELLLKNSADPNLCGPKNIPPILKATFKGLHNIIELLLNHDADPNIIIDDTGACALIASIVKSDIKSCEMLLDGKADPNIITTTGMTPLITSILSNNLKMEMSKLLVKYNADVNLQGKNGWAPILYASQIGAANIVSFLIENDADANIKTKDGRTALIETVSWGNKETAVVLLDAGVDIDAEDDYGRTAVSIAQSLGKDDILELFSLQRKSKT